MKQQTTRERRLASVVKAVCSRQPSLALSAAAAAGSDVEDHADVDVGTPHLVPPQLLTLDALKQFVRDGFMVLQLSDVPAAVHDAIYDVSYAIEGKPAEIGGSGGGGRTWLRRGDESAKKEDATEPSGGGGGLGVSVAQTKLAATRGAAAGWEALAPLFCKLMASCVVRGAATSICGEDYVASEPPAAPQPIGIVDRSLDQQWHKDMTTKGIREHCPREISAWYYPCDTELEMGPTCILPSSHLCGRDRLGCPHSEDRFDAAMDPAGKTLRGWKAGADQAIYLRGDHSARQRRLDEGQALLGDTSIQARSMTVRAGSIVLKHNDIVHRRSRAQNGSNYRPMFGLGSFYRTREPEPGRFLLAPSSPQVAASNSSGHSTQSTPDSCLAAPTSWRESDLAASSPKVAVWECLISWHLGHGCTLPATIRESSIAPSSTELQERLLTSNLEMERLGAAYTLATRGKLSFLAHALGVAESTRRAACWGFGAAGPAALSVLAPLLSDHNTHQQVVSHAVSAVGHAIGNSSSQTLRNFAHLDQDLQSTIDLLVAATRRADTLIDGKLSQLTAEEREKMADAVARGGRGYDGKVYACEEEMDLTVLGLRQTIMAATTGDYSTSRS